MKRWLLSLSALFLFGVFLLPGSAGAVRVDDPQRLAVGEFHGTPSLSFAVDDKGGLWAWGYNEDGMMGQTYARPEMDDYSSSHTYCYTPTKILDDVVWVACGGDFGAAIKSDHSLWMWGNNTLGQLGNGGRSNKGYELQGYTWKSFHRYQDAPLKIMEDVAAISCFDQSVAVIKLDGSLWTWGKNDDDQLGNGGKGSLADFLQARYKAVPEKIMDDVAAVSMGEYGAAAVKTDGTLWTWGNGYLNQLGNGNLDAVSDVPVQIGEGYRDVTFGQTSFAIKEDNSLWGWGYVTGGGLVGNVDLYDRHEGRERYQTTPVKLMEGVDKVYTVNDYDVDTDHLYDMAAAIKTDGSLWVWGGDATGVLGIPRDKSGTRQIYPPTKLLDNVSHVALLSHALALDRDGTLWAWGTSTLGEVYDPAKGLIGERLHSADEDWQAPVAIPAALLDLSAGAVPSEDDAQPDAGAAIPAEPLELVSAGVDPQEAGVAQSVRQPIEIRDERVELAGYALSDGAGGVTAYVRLRDLAWLLNGTAAQFDVGYDGAITLTPNTPYSSPNGTEGAAPFQGDQRYTRWQEATVVGGREAALRAFVLTDSQGGGHTYYKLRDLGQVLGFNVGWSRERGTYLEPGVPYRQED